MSHGEQTNHGTRSAQQVPPNRASRVRGQTPVTARRLPARGAARAYALSPFSEARACAHGRVAREGWQKMTGVGIGREAVERPLSALSRGAGQLAGRQGRRRI